MPRRNTVRLVAGFLILALTGTPLAAESSTDLMLVFDASGSMWAQIEGENKIVIARRVLGELIDGLPDGAEVGLIAYGHRREGDCEDIETLAALGPLDRGALKQTVDALNPKGKTPITRSVKAAFDAVRDREGGATVILVSDGVETCGGDPCAAVRLAKDEGLDFILHVVGFDVAGEDVSQLECAAQAGGGLFMSAENAGELGAALEAAVAMPPDVPIGRLVVAAITDGELQDVSISVTETGSGKQVAGSRTYARAETNPRSIPLPDGRFDVKVQAVGIKGDVVRRFPIEIAGGSTVEKSFDFSTGELQIGATRNGELSDAVYHVYVAGTRDQVAQGRTYTSPNRNPVKVRITSGEYEVELGSVEISGKPTETAGPVTLGPGGQAKVQVEFASGTLKVGAVQGDELVDATVSVVDATTGKATAQGRTYVSETSNPKTFVVAPGRYRVTVKAVKLKGVEPREFEVSVAVGGTYEHHADFGS